MKEEKKIEFTQKWIGDAVKALLQKEDIYESDMERIKYLRIGDCDFCGDYMIEISTAAPPVLEVVETDFNSLTGIDDLVRLKQLCCWLD
ncbi:MAG: hypothetical protein K2N73_01655 [Lachnospiraceae bacterium]|nr:hypothetical protein [Lachnospiraceae bacterium]